MDTADELVQISQGVRQSSVKSINECNKKIEAIKTMYLEVNQCHQRMQKLVRKDIEALQNEEKLLEEQSKRIKELLKTTKQELQELQQKHTAANQKLLVLSAKHKTQKEEYECLKDEYQRLLEEKDRLENETAIQLPKKREEVNLYRVMSNIHFDFDGAKDEIKGYISNTRDRKTFSFDTNKCSQFFITNSLWDSMNED